MQVSGQGGVGCSVGDVHTYTHVCKVHFSYLSAGHLYRCKTTMCDPMEAGDSPL